MDPCYDIASFFTHPESLSIPHADRMRVFEACCSASDDRTFFDRISVYMTLLPAQWIAKILSLIAHYDRQIVQEGVRPRPKQALWEDLERYFEMAENRRAKGLL
jgi:hypothetical protein